MLDAGSWKLDIQEIPFLSRIWNPVSLRGVGSTSRRPVSLHFKQWVVDAINWLVRDGVSLKIIRMDPPKQGGRAIKSKVYRLLKSQDFDKALKEIESLPAHRVINPLFSFLYNKDEAIKWAAIAAMGVIVSKVADENMEAARVVMRRLMWNLNDESGGIGWGSPEAMGEIMAVHEGLAKEYVHILISYTREDGNYLEYENLQRGLLWGIGRLAQVRPGLLKESAPHLIPYLQSPDAGVRGHAAWIMGLLKAEEARSELDALTEDETALQLTLNRRPIVCRVKELAREALRKMPAKESD